MSNIIQAIINIANEPIVQLKDSYTSRNTINNIGQALEAYIQDAFANTVSESNLQKRNERISKVFSYLGNQNNPPDIILKAGDAIEVKKIQSKGAAIALNSSYPKNKLHSDDSKITDACRDCEDWTTKDIIYAIGVTSDKNLKHLWLVYGDCYAASRNIYTRIGKTIKEGVKEIEDIEFSETKELGRVNRVDPLGITNLRIRGMWNIDNPLKVYRDYYEADETKVFSLACIIREDKFHSFNSSDRESLSSHNDIVIKDIEIKDPDNPAKLLNAKLITLEVS
ncbi:NgoPII family restriction endonuclease [Candidatus Woesearchaeota archaeon]|jgi:hypothetical protein|nr:NgoPII family restriction endonuclease [Candidatus Woesearchaeota archaeon]